MDKKINCRHGLTPSQEIEARKLRKKMQEGDLETLKIFQDMFFEYVKESKGPYVEYVRSKNPVYYSVLIREMDTTGPKETYYRILNC